MLAYLVVSVAVTASASVNLSTRPSVVSPALGAIVSIAIFLFVAPSSSYIKSISTAVSGVDSSVNELMSVLGVVHDGAELAPFVCRT